MTEKEKQNPAARLLNEQVETAFSALQCAEDEAYSARSSYEEFHSELGSLKRQFLKMMGDDKGTPKFIEIDGETYFLLRLDEC